MNDSFRVGVEYTESKYKDFSYQVYQGGQSVGLDTCDVTAITGGNAQIGFWNVNCNGFQLPRTPKWSGNVVIPTPSISPTARRWSSRLT
jgi:iron complex outermembrane receptor protein